MRQYREPQPIRPFSSQIPQLDVSADSISTRPSISRAASPARLSVFEHSKVQRFSSRPTKVKPNPRLVRRPILSISILKVRATTRGEQAGNKRYLGFNWTWSEVQARGGGLNG